MNRLVNRQPNMGSKILHDILPDSVSHACNLAQNILNESRDLLDRLQFLPQGLLLCSFVFYILCWIDLCCVFLLLLYSACNQDILLAFAVTAEKLFNQKKKRSPHHPLICEARIGPKSGYGCKIGQRAAGGPEEPCRLQRST